MKPQISKVLEHRNDDPSGKFHTMKVCFPAQNYKNIVIILPPGYFYKVYIKQMNLLGRNRSSSQVISLYISKYHIHNLKHFYSQAIQVRDTQPALLFISQLNVIITKSCNFALFNIVSFKFLKEKMKEIYIYRVFYLPSIYHFQCSLLLLLNINYPLVPFSQLRFPLVIL
jgi:hypothetical protein